MKIKTLFCAAAFFALFSIYTYSIEASVVSVSGKVEVQQGSSWVPLKAGTKVSSGQVISTGFKSSAELKIGASVVNVGPLTRLSLEQLASNAESDSARLHLDTGSVSANVNKTDNRRIDFRVSSPAATAAVRGTSFTFRADGKLVTTEGTVIKLPAKSSSGTQETQDSSGGESGEEGESEVSTSQESSSSSSTESSAPSDLQGGVAVSAGQTSKTDIASGKSTNPSVERTTSVATISGSPSQLSKKESISSASSSVSTVSNNDFASASAKQDATLIITLTFEDD